jgi:hypothetical protein
VPGAGVRVLDEEGQEVTFEQRGYDAFPRREAS